MTPPEEIFIAAWVFVCFLSKCKYLTFRLRMSRSHIVALIFPSFAVFMNFKSYLSVSEFKLWKWIILWCLNHYNCQRSWILIKKDCVYFEQILYDIPLIQVQKSEIKDSVIDFSPMNDICVPCHHKTVFKFFMSCGGSIKFIKGTPLMNSFCFFLTRPGWRVHVGVW